MLGRSDSSLAFDLSLKNENISGVSTTSCIYTNPFCTSSSNLSFLTSLPSLTNSDLLSCFAPFITSSINKESNLRFSSDDINSPMSFSIFIDSSLSISGIYILNSAILTSQKEFNQSYYLNFSHKICTGTT